ncbi:hypothetical protein [Aquincola sp. J276]|uniref:hypothetical protein n=1 Tax=Aquincola sp. J276 TaxID=2898432 RepID=UPI002151724A|nr:hypothetical protein [Aquincola sp. J276]MCR5868941.1 hypothetical protein [Aquincola sp. J276]
MLLLLACAAVAAAVMLALQPTAVVSGPSATAGFDLRRGWLLLRAHDPRRLVPGQPGHVQLDEAELQWLVDQAVARGPAGTAVRVALAEGSAGLQASLPVPAGLLPAALVQSLGGWLNVDLRLRQPTAAGLPEVTALRLGRLSVPPALAVPLVQWALPRAAPGALPALELLQVVRTLHFTPGGLEIGYVWGEHSLHALGAALLPAEERVRLQAYALAISRAAGTGASPWPLPQLLQTVFTLAGERSATEAQAAAENRAALRALALLATGRPLQPWLPPGERHRAGPPRPLLLHGRVDFPQHVVVSAALAAEGGGPLADAIGVYKELLDAREGSGFSFNDIAADRAGTRLGLLAMRQPRQLQQRLAKGVVDDDLLPDVSGLPEYLPEPVFRRRYGGVGSPAYEAMLAEIEKRLLGSPLLR